MMSASELWGPSRSSTSTNHSITFMSGVSIGGAGAGAGRRRRHQRRRRYRRLLGEAAELGERLVPRLVDLLHHHRRLPGVVVLVGMDQERQLVARRVDRRLVDVDGIGRQSEHREIRILRLVQLLQPLEGLLLLCALAPGLGFLGAGHLGARLLVRVAVVVVVLLGRPLVLELRVPAISGSFFICGSAGCNDERVGGRRGS